MIMDPFSITVGVFGLLQTVTSCLKFVKKRVGPSALSASEAEELKRSLYNFHGVMGSFQMHLQLHDDDDDRISSLEYLKPALDRSAESLQIINRYLAGGRTDKLFGGAKFDKQIKSSLKSLDDASKIFNMAVLSDQQTIMHEVKNFVRTMNEEVKTIQSVQSEVRQDNQYSEVIAWLGAQDDNNMNSQLHDQHILNRHAGSGKSLVNHGLFQDWLHTADQGKLWLRGPPGTGKSFFCSAAIEHVSRELPCVSLYQFCRFDDQFVSSSSTSDPSGGVRAAALLVHQLFRHFWQKDERVATPASTFIKTADKTLATLAELACVIVRNGYRYATEKSGVSDSEPIRLFLFLDGLDENKDLKTGLEAINLFEKLGTEVPLVQKLWISSRETFALGQRLKDWPVLGGDGLAEDDVKTFLAENVSKVSKNLGTDREIEGKPLAGWILENLQAKARGNFLYARLMLDWLRDDVFTIDDVTELMTSRVPDKLTEIYKRIFLQYRWEQHKYTSLLFSLIAFARRPLRLREVREAMTLALSDPDDGLDPLKTPMTLQRLFTPLIEIQHDPFEPQNPFCRLCHFTVQEFLAGNPNILHIVSPNKTFPAAYAISRARIGDLCLRYLSLTRYATPLDVSNGECRELSTFQTDEFKEHSLLPYCAKFWVRHLDDLEPTAELHKRLLDFMKSPNFQTLLQAQSLFVAAQFSRYTVNHASWLLKGGVLYRPILPRWAGDKLDEKQAKEVDKIRGDYRRFVAEWGYLLDRCTCFKGCESQNHFVGEVDRCLKGLLGPTHFMKGTKEKYESFMLADGDEHTRSVIAEAVSGSTLQYITLTVPSKGSSVLLLNTWELHGPNNPIAVSKTVDTVASNAPDPDKSRAVVSFSKTAESFFLGDYTIHGQSNQIPIILPNARTARDSQPLSVDIDRRDDIVVIASRDVQRPTKPALVQKVPAGPDLDWSDDEPEEAEHPDDDDPSSPSSESDDSAYETYSEGSTDTGIHSSEEESEGEEYPVSDSEKSEENNESEADECDSEPESRMRPGSSRLPQSSGLTDDPLQLENEPVKATENKRPTYPGQPGRFRESGDRLTANLTVYRVSSGKPARIFHYRHNIPTMLYQSPPVLHPYSPLLVWPLGGGELLFVDYEEKTYFIRATMPSTRGTRHICMKPQFSPCGNYLHIASIEGRPTSIPRSVTKRTNDNKTKPEITLSLFLTTHRLSTRKRTHSPPHLTHKAKLTLGKFTGLSLARLPFTFTWTPSHLHFTVSGHRLNVFRVGLFPSATEAVVTIPRLPVMLPLSASNREVYYLPPVSQSPGESTRGVVLLGSYAAGREKLELRRRSWASAGVAYRGLGSIRDNSVLEYECPAVGFYVEEDGDLGGWVALPENDPQEGGEGSVVAVAGTEAGARLRSGRLTRRIEVFDWGDDVDLEGICDWCGGAVILRGQY